MTIRAANTLGVCERNSKQQRQLSEKMQWIILLSFSYMVRIATGCSLMEKDTTYEIVKSSGESALLPCSCSPLHAKPERVIWDVKRKGYPYRSSIEIPITSGPYSGRVQMFNQHSPGNASLLISDLTEEDQGTYRCYLNGEVKRIHLLIKDLHPILPTSTSTPKAPPKSQTTVTIDKDIVKNGGGETPLYVFIFVAVLLLLLPLGGVIFLYMRHKGQKGGSTQSGGMQERNNDSSYEALQHRYNAEQMYSTIGQNAGVQATAADYENPSSD
ncbi:uncharacterized protein LOC134092733 isoform X2 [Sardina pilchardus]|uniref:uncharacterized protein LOC134092733 isoform X2 n=1 Tax=Sardina pilchardus TaxID=27697 RepID=UPI002E0EE00A